MFSPTYAAFCSDGVGIEIDFVCLLGSSCGLDKKKQGPGSFVHIIYFPAFSIRASLSLVRNLTFIFTPGQISNIPQERCVITAQF